jgi:hypothetical protein
VNAKGDTILALVGLLRAAAADDKGAGHWSRVVSRARLGLGDTTMNAGGNYGNRPAMDRPGGESANGNIPLIAA